MKTRSSSTVPARPRFILDPKLDSYAYRCWPDGCPRDRTCCVGLAVEVSRREVRAIDSLMDELARIVPTLREDDGYASVFVDEEPPDLLIESDDDGACPFLFRTRKHALCSVHSVALSTGRAVPQFKQNDDPGGLWWPQAEQRSITPLLPRVSPKARRE